MAISTWAETLRRFFVQNGERRPRRRREKSSGFSARGVQVEQCESRVMLSAGPVIVLAPPGPMSFVEHSGPEVIAAHSTVTDTSVANFNGGTLTESLMNANAADQLGIRNQGNGAGKIGVAGNTVDFGGVAIGTVSGGNGSTPLVVTLNANATPAAVQALQDNITFNTTADSAASVNSARTLQSVVTDGAIPVGIASAPVTETINVVEADPTINLHESSVSISNSSAKPLAPDVVISSPETHNIGGGTLTVALSNGTSRDSLAIQSHGASQAIRTQGNTILDNGVAIGTFTGGAGTTPLVIKFNSKATIADAQAVARDITFRSIGHFAHQTNATFKLTDGDGGVSKTATMSLNITHGGKGKGGDGDSDDGDGGDKDKGKHKDD